MSSEFTQFVAKIIEVIEEKKTSDLKYRQAFSFDPGVYHELPLVTVVFDRCIPERMNRDQARYELHADITYYYAKMSAGLRMETLNDRLAFLGQWLMKNQTLKGFVLSTWIDEMGFSKEEVGGTIVAAGTLHLHSAKDRIDIKDVND